MTPPRTMTTYLASATGALLLGFFVYGVLAGLGGGIDWEDRMTFDQSGELELEGVALLFGLVFAVLVGVPLGSYMTLRMLHAPRAGASALLTLAVAGASSLLALSTIPSAPVDPLLAPYGVFGGWFLSALLARWIVLRIAPPPPE